MYQPTASGYSLKEIFSKVATNEYITLNFHRVANTQMGYTDIKKCTILSNYKKILELPEIYVG